tara:strand:+ start:1101 stop:1619 length:519 start_codon:yes stop_codon:yes gene_type:complete
MKTSIFLGTRVEALSVLIRYTKVVLIITEKDSFIDKSQYRNEIKSIYVDGLSKRSVNDILEKAKVDIVLSAGFKFVLPLNIINNGPIYINSHPSYLPKYKGKNAIKDAIKNKEKYIGVTLHYMDEAVDSGKIIYQKKITVNELSLNEIYNKIFSKLEPEVINIGIKEILNDK